MIKHILFPTDGSEAANKALEYLKKVARNFEAEVTLLHTYEFTMGHVLSRYSSDSHYIADLEKRYEEFGQSLLSNLQTTLNQEQIKVRQALVYKGDAGQLILKTAEQENCDLILLGNRGLGVVKSFFLGSTSHYVVNHSKNIPVFLIPVEE